MRREFSLLLTLALSGLFGAAAGCGSDPVVEGCDPTCSGCCDDGQKCATSSNCRAGSICNTDSADLFDPAKDLGVCIRVVCADDTECAEPKKCGLERICQASVCQTDEGCAPGTKCLGGECKPAPSANDVTSCLVVTAGGAILESKTITLNAVAKNANGAVLPGIDFTWASSAPGAVAVAGNIATGGTTSGQAVLTAKVTGKESVVCDRNTTLTNFANLAANQARVVLTADDDGTPIEGAQVTLIAGGNPTAQATGADGSTTFNGVAGDITSITVVKAGWQYVSVLSPPKDTFLPLPRIADRTKAGGFRGSVDLSATKKGEVRLGIAAPSIPANLLDFDFESLLGDSIETTLDAPDLGLDNEVVDLPGGVVFALSTKRFTDDSGTTNLRCQGRAPTDNELGCYVARAPKGPGAAWALAGRLPMTAVSKVAGALSSALGGDTGDVDIGAILTKVLPLFRGLNHAINAGLVITESTKVNKPGQTGDCADPNLDKYDDKCQGDFAQYQSIALAASQPLGVNSVVSVPNLPTQADGTFADGMIVIPAAITDGRGIVPLGLAAGVDILTKTETADGRIAGVTEPFGPNSDPLQDGQVGLSMAPPHSGAEGSKIALIAVALDLASIGGDGGTQLSGLVKHVAKVDAQTGFGADAFLSYPKGTFSQANATFTPNGAVATANVTRLEFGNGPKTWLVYAPAGGTPITLPDVATPRTEIIAAGLDMTLQSVRGSAAYSEVFTFGSGKNLNRAVELIDAFAVQECMATAGSPCLLQ